MQKPRGNLLLMRRILRRGEPASIPCGGGTDNNGPRPPKLIITQAVQRTQEMSPSNDESKEEEKKEGKSVVIHRTAEPETWYDSERRRQASPSGEREGRL